MVRTFKYYAIRSAGHPQPLVGGLVAASYVPGSHVLIQVDDSSGVRKGDRVLLCEKDGTLAEIANVEAVPDGTHVQVDLVANNHTGGVIGTGGWVVLNTPINSMYVQPKDSNVGAAFVGTSPNMVTATGVNMVAQLMAGGAGVQPNDVSDVRAGFPNADSSSEWWIDGTTADKYLPSFGIV